ncbi:MAG: hypothetical protein M3R04_08595, partial [bacterium]|nr:hypothetical protein [bacterium]
VRVSQVFLGMLITLIVVMSGIIVFRQMDLSVNMGTGAPAGEVDELSPVKELYYSTMHPWIVQDHPGSCPICGMELVKMPADMQAEWERNRQLT